MLLPCLCRSHSAQPLPHLPPSSDHLQHRFNRVETLCPACRLAAQMQRSLRVGSARAKAAPAIEVNVNPAGMAAGDGCPRGPHWQVHLVVESYVRLSTGADRKTVAVFDALTSQYIWHSKTLSNAETAADTMS